MVAWNLPKIARSAITEARGEIKDDPPIVDPNSNDNTANKISIAIAKKFLTKACPAFLEAKTSHDVDRLVKVGRSLADLVSLDDDDDESEKYLSAGLSSIIEQCDILATNDFKVPKVRFGKTDLQMSIVTLGCMRFQQTWAPSIKDLKDVKQDCQQNLYNLLKYSIEERGINHIETANMYGSSEIQLGDAFQKLFDSGTKREDLIIQSKVNAFDPDTFRKTLDDSFSKLRLDYIDLFTFHGVNFYSQYETIFNNPDGENLMDIAKEYVAAGKIRHIGFSSHAQPELIKKCIDTDAFEYANIHLHAFGSYTASGGGACGGNLDNARLMKDKDMGLFIISPYDKGGKLYAPSKKLRSLTLPDLEPIQYGSLWCFHLQDLDEEGTPAHTIVCGAARPSDLDEPAIAAYLFGERKDETMRKVKAVSERLRQAEIDALGEKWLDTWHEGLPNCNGDDKIHPFGQIVWLHNIIKAWGMWDFAKDRYESFDSNTKGWKHDLSIEENINAKKIMWGYMPGVAYEEDKDYSDILVDVPEDNRGKVKEALKFVHKVCSKNSTDKGEIPDDWTTSYDMRPWTAFPERG
jgi:predicted aldo/keto reductase-like oxidoreductase